MARITPPSSVSPSTKEIAAATPNTTVNKLLSCRSSIAHAPGIGGEGKILGPNRLKRNAASCRVNPCTCVPSSSITFSGGIACQCVCSIAVCVSSDPCRTTCGEPCRTIPSILACPSLLLVVNFVETLGLVKKDEYCLAKPKRSFKNGVWRERTFQSSSNAFGTSVPAALNSRNKLTKSSSCSTAHKGIWAYPNAQLPWRAFPRPFG